MKSLKLAFNLLGVLFFLNSLQAQNYPVIDSLIQEIELEDEDLSKINLMNHLDKQLHGTNAAKGFSVCEALLSNAQKNEDYIIESLVLKSIGNLYYLSGDYLNALKYLDQAETVLIKQPQKDIEAGIYYNKAVVFYYINKLKQARNYADLALELYQENNDDKMLGSVYTIYSAIYGALEDLDNSFKYDRLAYQNAIQQKDTLNIARCLHNLGIQYSSRQQVDSAIIFFKRAIEINTKQNNINWLATNYISISNLMLNNNILDSASIYIDKAHLLYEEVGFKQNLDYIFELKALIALENGDLESAIKYFQSITQCKNVMHGNQMKSNAYHHLYEIYKSKNQIELALECYQKHHQYEDSVKQENNTGLLTVMEMQMDYKEEQNRLELENKEVKLRSQRIMFIVLLLILIIAALSISIYFVYKLQKAKAKTARTEKKLIEDELEHKKREMTTNVMALMKKNNMLGDISKKILEIEKGAIKDETKYALRQVSNEVRKSKEHKLREEFDIRFTQVSQEFYNKLSEKYPDISSSEMRMCAFLRMNLSTKEIAEITGLLPKSIDNARSKIRKKLELGTQENLSEFLLKV